RTPLLREVAGAGPDHAATAVARGDRALLAGDLLVDVVAVGGGDDAVIANFNLGHVGTGDRAGLRNASRTVAVRETALVGPELGHAGLGTGHQGGAFGNLRTDGVVLIRRQRDGGQDGDDRDDDHQFDQGKALLLLHFHSPRAVVWKGTRFPQEPLPLAGTRVRGFPRCPSVAGCVPTSPRPPCRHMVAILIRGDIPPSVIHGTYLRRHMEGKN